MCVGIVKHVLEARQRCVMRQTVGDICVCDVDGVRKQECIVCARRINGPADIN